MRFEMTTRRSGSRSQASRAAAATACGLPIALAAAGAIAEDAGTGIWFARLDRANTISDVRAQRGARRRLRPRQLPILTAETGPMAHGSVGPLAPWLTMDDSMVRRRRTDHIADGLTAGGSRRTTRA